jgi:hypothetical protein
VETVFVLWIGVEIEEPENWSKREIKLILAFLTLGFRQRYGLGWGLIE